MKQVIKSILLTILMSMVGIKSFAYDIAVDNADGVTIYYNYINDGQELEVTYQEIGWDNRKNYIGNVVIPEEVTFMTRTRKVTSIGACAFWYCSGLTSVTIPNSVTSIGHEAFKNCSNLTSVSIPNSVTTIGKESFSHCKSLTSITIPNRVTEIEREMFDSCEKLASVTIPNSVTKIGVDAFGGCKSLTSITIPNSVTTICGSAFVYCSGLTSITIPYSVSIIENEAFDNCDLSIVISEIETPFDIYEKTFSNHTYYNATLYVPVGTIDKYKSKDGWRKFLYIVEGSPTSISDIKPEDENEIKRYTLDGRVVNNSHKGINIIQMNNGTTKKVLVR